MVLCQDMQKMSSVNMPSYGCWPALPAGDITVDWVLIHWYSWLSLAGCGDDLHLVFALVSAQIC